MRSDDPYTHRFANRCALETPGRRGRDRRSAPPKSTVVQAAVDLGHTPQNGISQGRAMLSSFFVSRHPPSVGVACLDGSDRLSPGLQPGRLVTTPREPMFNVPLVVLAMVGVFGLVHALFALVLTPRQGDQLLLLFAFIPARYDMSLLAAESWARGWGAAVWSFVTYAFIHANLNHLFFNSIWLLAFGTPV